MIYITGDKHGDVSEIERFTQEYRTTKDDLLIILGDAGFNYGCMKNDQTGKYDPTFAIYSYSILKRLPITIAVVQGNHEAPAWDCSHMRQVKRFGNDVYQATLADNVYFLKNGEIYLFNGKKYLVLGGAYSIDKYRRHIPNLKEDKNACGYGYWFEHEQMSDDEFKLAYQNMAKEHNTVYGILSHTCPKSIVPLYAIDKIFANDRMESKLEKCAEDFRFDIWYFGHFHDNRIIQKKYHLLFEKIEELQ